MVDKGMYLAEAPMSKNPLFLVKNKRLDLFLTFLCPPLAHFVVPGCCYASHLLPLLKRFKGMVKIYMYILSLLKLDVHNRQYTLSVSPFEVQIGKLLPSVIA